MEYYKNKVSKWYHEAVVMNVTADSALKNSLKSHERAPKFILNLATEIEKVQNNRLKSGKPKFQETTLKGFVYDFVDMFLILVKKQKDEAYQSELNKIIAERKAQELKDLEDTANGKPSGIYKEIEMTSPIDRELENGQT